MTAHVIKMPDIGEGIAEVELVAWHVKPGDSVVEDQPLADVMTDKASVEIPSPVVGTVVSLGGEVGQTLAVGSELIRIEVAVEGEATTEAASASATTSAPAPALAPAPEPAQEATPQIKAPPPAPAEAKVATPVAVPQDLSAGRAAAHAVDRPIASPSVRRRAMELMLDLSSVTGSGLGGRIMHADLDASSPAKPAGAPPVRVAATPAAATSVLLATPAAASTPPPQRGAERHDEQTVAVIGLRRKIAQKMQESKRRIPHFTYVEEIDLTELEGLRATLNARWAGKREKLTVLPFLVRAIVNALEDFPQLNARFDDEAGVVTRYGAAHIGIATQTDAGLMVPVLRHAEALDLWACAAGVARLASSVRSGKITRDELSGSTITLTSLGALGGIVSTPVINHPEVAIVGVNRMVERPMMRSGVVVPRLMMNLSSSFDHRVVDGIDAARFIQALRGMLESPATLFIT